MKKNLFVMGILAFVLIFGMTVLGCKDAGNDSGDGGGTDIWTDVTSLSQLDGKWKATDSNKLTITEGVTYKEKVEVTIIINANAKTKTQSSTVKATLSGSGDNFNFVWNTYKTTTPEGTNTDPDGNTYTTSIDDATHTITVTYSPKTTTYTDAQIAGMLSGVQINQNGTKMKAEGMIFDKQ